MTLSSVFDVNQNVIKVYNNKNIKFFYQDFVDIALEACGSIVKIEKYDLVIKIAVPQLQDCFLLVIFSNSHSMICIWQFKLSKILDVT